ncbi:MAG: YkgJ family cysteine cluster protein [Deltaproteobacteria bacterium]|nr:YkgJ family cysteine cluster protein [Deltaproteobacteria bacterium]
MRPKKFTGKIRTDPWEALARGPREVMASLWEEYLTEVSPAVKGSGRFRLLRRRIEDAAGYQDIFGQWNVLPPAGRAAAWRRLVETARRELEATREVCLRCGECCENSSPTLLVADLPLLQQEVLTWNEVYAMPVGDVAISPEGKPIFLQEERLKVREVPGTRQCWFYQAAQRRCRIYEQRPEHCRRQQCWGEPPPEPEPEEFLHRGHLFRQIPEVWDLITAHQERCDRVKVRQTLTRLAAGEEEAGGFLFEALHFDHHLREVLTREWGLTTAAVELLLGRSLTEFLPHLGFRAKLTPEGVFKLEPRRSCLTR